jgi:spore coat polysaccharide biosynthesis predicted glycosyltransferase SpsG
MSPRSLRVLIHVAGGPRRGFGHLVRSTWLARALGVEPVVCVRGGREAVRVARQLGHRVVGGTPSAVLARHVPDLVIVDDPNASAANRWCAAARRAGTPVASVHDLGLARCASDLPIDGSIAPFRGGHGPRALTGPRYAVLNPKLRALRRSVKSRTGEQARPRVLITLGGGARAQAARRLAVRLARLRPDVDVCIAGGFLSTKRRPGPANVRWLRSADRLAGELARATVALVAGGVTLYEACCLGVPTVAVAVVNAQRPTVRAFAARGAVIDAGTSRTVTRAVAAVQRLLDDERARRALGRRARAQVDGLGAVRVASALRRLARANSGDRHCGRPRRPRVGQVVQPLRSDGLNSRRGGPKRPPALKSHGEHAA